MGWIGNLECTYTEEVLRSNACQRWISCSEYDDMLWTRLASETVICFDLISDTTGVPFYNYVRRCGIWIISNGPPSSANFAAHVFFRVPHLACRVYVVGMRTNNRFPIAIVARSNGDRRRYCDISCRVQRFERCRIEPCAGQSFQPLCSLLIV